MFVKLDDDTILDMITGTCYQRTAYGKDNYDELRITFNGQQRDKFCSGVIATGLWDWLDNAALKFESEVQA